MKKRDLLILAILISISIPFLKGPKIAHTGSNVTVEYVGIVDNHTFPPKTISFIVGEGKLIPGLELAVRGMHEGEVKNVLIPPELGFGEYNQSLVFEVPILFFIKEKMQIPKIGEKVKLNDRDGIVVGITNNSVIIDTNNPLAGKTINLTIKLIKVQ